jgi:hypothetical protein
MEKQSVVIAKSECDLYSNTSWGNSKPCLWQTDVTISTEASLGHCRRKYLDPEFTRIEEACSLKIHILARKAASFQAV